MVDDANDTSEGGIELPPAAACFFIVCRICASTKAAAAAATRLWLYPTLVLCSAFAFEIVSFATMTTVSRFYLVITRLDKHMFYDTLYKVVT